VLANREGDWEQALSLNQEALALYRELGHEHGVTGSLYNLAFLHFQAGRPEESATLLRESFRLAEQTGDAIYAILALFLLASLAERAGEAAYAATLLGAAEAEQQRVGLTLAGTPEGELEDAARARLRAQLGEEEFETARAAGGAAGLRAVQSFPFTAENESAST
jgi:tetratricopeptide (TPR) repeat protein